MAEEPAKEQEVNDDYDESQDDVLSLNEVVDMGNQLIEQSAVVLGAANDKACSYVEGYLKRQPLYSCLTCIPEAKNDPEKGAGICLGCSYHCHDGHELIELYTKRNFRCDCGNKKFPNGKCNLFNEKSDSNDLNCYNQNFSGLYCICHRPYPDFDDSVQDEMMQCVICEDWYHTRHLGVEAPEENNFAEMVCENCMKKHEFLLCYDENMLPVTVDDQPQENGTNCKKPKEKSTKITAKFWTDVNWRQSLCKCDDCLKMYKNENVAFLIDSEDPVSLYEEKGKANVSKIIQNQEDKLFKNMGRVALINCIAEYNDFKEQLGDFLQTFAVSKRVIKEEDVKGFFEGMNARKKRRVEVPNFCR